MAPTSFRRAGTSRRRTGAFFGGFSGALPVVLPVAVVLFALLFAPAVAAADGGGDEGQLVGELRVTQNLSLRVGTFVGDRDAFLRHEDLTLPSLNPDIDLAGQVGLRVGLPGNVRVSLQSKTGEKPSHSFGIGYGQWDLEYGPQSASFSRAGLNYSRALQGLRLRHQPAGQAPTVEVFSAQTSSRHADIDFRGDDTFGPFFLGQKDIVEQSEQVFIDGRRQTRGTGPGDGDYYVDYSGGFLYFNKVVLAHETVRVSYEYSVELRGLSSTFTGIIGAYDFGAATAHAFALRDHIPLEEGSILEQSGSTLLAYGTNVETAFPSGAQMTNTLLATDLHRYDATTTPTQDEIVVVEGEARYRLQRTPVLYQSERITVAGPHPEQLVRNLDYVVDYHTGDITLTYEAPTGTRLIVDYTYIDAGNIAATTRSQGAQTSNRFRYNGPEWRTTAWLDGVVGDFVSARTHTPPRERFSAGTNTEYAVDDAWSVLADFDVLGRSSTTVVRPALGVRYNEHALDASLRLNGQLAETNGHAVDEYYVHGNVGLSSFADVEIDFNKRLDDAAGFMPEQFTASAVGTVGVLPFSVTYTHGDEHYAEKLQARLVLPAQGEHTRGLVTVASQFLYRDGFAAPPRGVYSLFGNVAYSPPSGLYLRAQGSMSLSRFGPMSTDTYTVRFDTGHSFGASTVLDYQLRLHGGDTRVAGSKTDARDSQSHMITVATALTDDVSAALVYRHADNFRRRADRGTTSSEERGVQASISGKLGAIEAAFTYDDSTTEVFAQTGDHVTDVTRYRLTLHWGGEKVSVRGALEFAVHDAARERLTAQLVPALRLSDHAELSFGYRQISSYTAGDAKAAYRAHLLETGITFEL